MIRGLFVVGVMLCGAVRLSLGQPPATTTVRATGVGRPPRHMGGAQAKLMARRAAEVIAVRNLAAKLRAVPASRGGIAHVRLGAGIRGFRYLPHRELPDGSIEVTVELGPPPSAKLKRADRYEQQGGGVAQQPRSGVQPRGEPLARRPIELWARLDETRKRLEAQVKRVEAAIGALEERLAALRKELAQVRAATADLDRMPPQAEAERVPAGEPPPDL